MQYIHLSISINEFSTSISGKKEKKLEGAAAGVSLSEGHALNEYHLLSETSARLVSKKNLPRKYALSAPSARPASHLSLPALSAPGSLSQKSLTRA